MASIKKVIKQIKYILKKRLEAINVFKLKKEINTLYALLYQLVHDLEEAVDISSFQTREAFANQWEKYKNGRYLLNDSWFRENVSRIIYEEEVQVKSDWFKGKEVLDAGCGNGRWSYGLAKLGANITAVDASKTAIDETRKAISEFNVKKEFYVSLMENLSENLPQKKFDLVFCWGVLHHCKSFNKSLNELIKFVKKDGLLYLYLYGRKSLSYEDDIELFKQRIRYNALPNEKQRYNFLLAKARGNKKIIHNIHDLYAPIINRRLEFEYLKEFLISKGFEDVSQTKEHPELFIRAIKENVERYKEKWILPVPKPPFWFQHYKK